MAFPIAAAIALGGSLFGGIMSAGKRRRQRRLLKKRERQLENTFNTEYYTDYLEREQSKSFLSKLREGMKDATKVADNSAVVTGATQESQIAKKSALQKNYASAVNHLAGMASQHKDNVRNWYEGAKSGVYGQQQQMLGHEAQQWTNFMNNAASAAASFGSMGAGKAASAATPGITNAVNAGGKIAPVVPNGAFQLQGF